jgi:hypothetical protein
MTIVIIVVNFVLINAVKRRVTEDDMLRPITSCIIHIQGGVASGAIATNAIPVRIFIIPIAITEVILYLITWSDEMSVDIGTVGIPGKLYFYGTSRNIRIDSNSIAAAPAFGIGGSHSYSVRAWGQFERGAEAIVITASPHKS